MDGAGAAHGRDEPPVRGGARPDYVETFSTGSRAGDGRSPEQWARSVFEDVPPPVRWFLLVGWRVGLGLRLGPRPSPEHVLGWRIAVREPHAVRLEVRSRWMAVDQVLRLDQPTTALTTRITYLRRGAGALWAVSLPLHRLLVNQLLRRAASRADVR